MYVMLSDIRNFRSSSVFTLTLLLCKPFIDSIYIWEIQLLYLMGTEKLIGSSVCMGWASPNFPSSMTITTVLQLVQKQKPSSLRLLYLHFLNLFANISCQFFLSNSCRIGISHTTLILFQTFIISTCPVS